MSITSENSTAIDALRERIRGIEGGSGLKRLVLPFGISEIDRRLPGGGLALGALHEVAGGGNGAIDSAAAALFAAGIAARTYTAAAALKQLNLTEGFHIAQALAGGRQRKPYVCRSVGDAACIYHGEEQAKVDQVEAHTDDNIRHTAFGPAEVCLRIIHIVDADECVT